MLTTLAPSRSVSRWLPAVGAAVLALAISSVVPLLSALLIALLIGAAVANAGPVAERLPADQAATTRLMLRLGIVCLGLRLPVEDLLGVGVPGLAIIVATVGTTFAVTKAVGNRLAMDSRLVTLLAAGFSICGAAAIAVIDEGVRAREKDVALAIGLVTVHGSLMIALVPWLSGVLGLRELQAGVWAGASIHEVAQVVAAASFLGTGAMAVAMTIKLGRVMTLAPVYAWSVRGPVSGGWPQPPVVPWFVAGFIVAIAVRSTGLVPVWTLDATQVLTTVLLAAGMFGLGLGLNVRDLWPVPWRALLLATISTAVAAGTSLILVLALI